MTFNENLSMVQEIWSRHESGTDGMMDRLTDRQTKGIPISNHLIRGGGLIICSARLI